MIGPVIIIKPLPAPWLGFGGDDFFGLSLAGRVGPFLSRRLSFPLCFLLNNPLVTPLGVDEEALSFYFYFRAPADALTKAFYLTASISTKGKRRTLNK